MADDRSPVDLGELERYLRIFQENPDSRVFAPLADLYRRLGRLRESEEICRDGIQRHPYYAGGRVALAHILLDASRLDEALSEVESVVTYYPDNLLARKILIRTLGGLGQVDRARREFEALKALAPLVAGDPDLERALQGRPVVQRMPAAPEHLPPSLPGTSIREGFINPVELQDKTQWQLERPSEGLSFSMPLDPTGIPLSPEAAFTPPPAVQRSRRLHVLLRKKLLLETLHRELDKSFNPS